MSFRFIKDRFRNLLIILVFLSGIPYLRFLVHRHKKSPLVRIICWHKITARERFSKKVRFLIKHFNIISIDDFINGKNLVYQRINLIISFDDGYKSWLHNALPVLEEYQLPALFFISSGYLNRTEAPGKEFVRDFKVCRAASLSSQEVKAIAANERFTVGSHGRYHKDLAAVEDSELQAELVEDKEYLESLTGRKVVYFAFPFGHGENFNKKIFDYYRWVFSIVPGFNKSAVSGRVLHRDSIDISFSTLLFLAWLYGGYDWYWPRRKKRNSLKASSERIEAETGKS